PQIHIPSRSAGSGAIIGRNCKFWIGGSVRHGDVFPISENDIFAGGKAGHTVIGCHAQGDNSACANASFTG
ncbi:MAG: hypothetical protein ACPG5U_07665, partial [Planktomarina sp.]